MKKLCVLLCVVLLLGLFSSCKEQKNDSAVEAPQPSYVPEQSPEINEEPTPESSREPQKEASILDGKVQREESEVLFSIPNEHINSGTGQKLLPYGDNFVVYGPVSGDDMGPAVKIFILSGATGEVLASKVFNGMDLAELQVCGQNIALSDWADGEVLLLDSSLETVNKLSTGTEYCGVFADPAGEYVYAFTRDDGIKVIAFDGAEKSVLLENSSSLYASNSTSSAVSFYYTDLETQLAMSGVLSFEQGRVLTVPFEGTFSSAYLANDIWLAPVFGASGEYCIGRQGRPSKLRLEAGSTASLLEENSRVMVSTYTDEGFIISLYESDGRFISRCSLGVGTSGVYSVPIWSEKDSGYFFTIINSDGKDELFFWDISVSTQGRDLVLYPFENEEIQGTAVDSALYERAHTLGKEFGVKIRIADTCLSELAEYEMALECSETVIIQALDAVERALSSYPDGFIEQLKFDVAKQIEIQLCGRITKKELPENVSGFSNFSGFMTREASSSVIVLDISGAGSLEQLIHHEIAHIIHSKLMHDARLREEAIFSDDAWQALQPSDFVYAETYDAIPMEYFSDGYEAWFIDLYSRTYAKEDIARILEYAASGQAWAFSSSKFKSAKLEYLCRCIRDAFDDTLWPEENIFEQTLNRAKQ